MLTKLWQIAYAVATGFFTNRLSTSAAAMAFYTMFALGPIMIFSIAIAEPIVGRLMAQQAVFDALGTVLPIAQIVAEARSRGITTLVDGAQAIAHERVDVQALGCDFYLRIALELYLKRLLVGGVDKVFEIGRNFRNEGLSRKHNPEFTMLEAYEAFGDYETMMDLVQGMVCHVAQEVLDTLVIEHKDAEGKATKQVADLLGISVKTADTHRTNLMRKLKLHSMPWRMATVNQGVQHASSTSRYFALLSTICLTAPGSRASCAASSIGLPSALATSISIMSGGRGSEPAWVVRIRLVLVCMVLFQLDVCGLDHLLPARGFIIDEGSGLRGGGAGGLAGQGAEFLRDGRLGEHLGEVPAQLVGNRLRRLRWQEYADPAR